MIIAFLVDGKESSIDLVFHSHDIEDASPPACSIRWDYSHDTEDASPPACSIRWDYSHDTEDASPPACSIRWDYSHDTEDASPPACSIQWDYSYKVPSGHNYKSSLLPGCYTAESREGFHMTYYWFYVLDWVYG